MRNAIFCLMAVAAVARAGTLQFDQFGDGSIDSTPLANFFGTDPGPGGFPNALTYGLPFTGVQGDLILTDPNFSDLPMEIIRFNGDGTLILYAGNLPDSPALISSPPGTLYDNIAVVSDTGPEVSNSATYTPVDGQPGFDSSDPTYIFDNSDHSLSEVPEPSTMAMCAASLAVLGLGGMQRRRRASGRREPEHSARS